MAIQTLGEMLPDIDPATRYALLQWAGLQVVQGCVAEIKAYVAAASAAGEAGRAFSPHDYFLGRVALLYAELEELQAPPEAREGGAP